MSDAVRFRMPRPPDLGLLVGRDSDESLFAQCTQNRFPDPPVGIREETVLSRRVVSAHGFNEPEVPFVDEILDGESAIAVAPGDLYDISKIAGDEAIVIG